ncbi:TPR protein [Medicago truncatula]|uniref:TPR protein n=2 Tax=Medicago truncatula TaxID=3880 RepID=A0A072UKD1_MEDTR|nr:TPR protein [Medicago truncatula]
MEAPAEGLWGLADHHEKLGQIAKAVKCLEAICQSDVSFYPIIEVKTRLRIATILLHHSHNVHHAKSHLQGCQLLLKSTQTCLELKCKVYSLLSQCYHLVGDIKYQKKILFEGLQLAASSAGNNEFSMKLWSCNFNSQLANALSTEGDYRGSVSAIERGYVCASKVPYPEMQMFFSTSLLHACLMHTDDNSLVAQAINKCNEIWESILPDQRRQCPGLFFYNELLQIFYHMRLCDYKKVEPHVDKLDAAVKAYREQLLGDKLQLAPPPIDGEWLPKSAVFALVDLIVVVFGRPKGNFKDCGKRIQSGMHIIQDELVKLGITNCLREADLDRSSIHMAGVYLMLLIQFLENEVAIELTRAQFSAAQEALIQMKNWFTRFLTILMPCECIIEILRGQYAHSVGCYNKAVFHFSEAVELTDSKSMQAMCKVYEAISYICIGDAESTSKADHLIRPFYEVVDSTVGAREKTGVLFTYGLLLIKQRDLPEARLVTGLKLMHTSLGNIQLMSQYLRTLGSLALEIHDTVQAKEILRSSLTLAKKLYDVPTQVWVLSVLTDLYKELGEKENQMENAEYQTKKARDLEKRLADAQASIYHNEIVSSS